MILANGLLYTPLPQFGPGLNYPGGMTIVLNTGKMTNTVSQVNNGTWNSGGPVPTTFKNFSPNTITAGEWAGNISNPSSGTGIQMNYPKTTVGGNSPCRFGIPGFAVTGTGFLYVAFTFMFSTQWNFSLASQVKLLETETVTAGNNNLLAFAAVDNVGNQISSGNAWPQYALQGNHTGYTPGGGSANGLPPNYTADNTIYETTGANLLGNPGSTYIFEMYLQPETPQNTGNNGQLTFWVNNTRAYTTVGKNDGTPGQTGINYDSGGYSGFHIDPTYGGDSASDHPPNNNCFWIIDQMFMAVK